MHVYSLLLCFVLSLIQRNPVASGQIIPIVTGQLLRLNLTQPKGSLPQPQLVQQHGYDIESFDITTEDKYILKIFHMTKSRKCRGNKTQPPVILTHGLLQDSDVWFDAGPDAGLGYILADDCHDVWLPNVRGNFYGRRHKKLNPNKDQKFWDFTADEMGRYDVPAFIDFVLNKTGAEDVNYIGFSQGCGTFYIMCDQRPEYCEKARLKISIAPATRHLNTKSLGFRYSTILFNVARLGLEGLGYHEAFPLGGLVQTALAYFCQIDAFYELCQTSLQIFDNENSGAIDKPTTKQLFYHFTAGTSVKNMAKYGQAQNSKTFDKFNYGPIGNLVSYGSLTAPVYDLSATTVPVVVIYGNNDGIVDRADAEWAANQLPNLLEAYKVSDPKWTHFDETDSHLVPNMTLPKIRQYLQTYSSD